MPNSQRLSRLFPALIVAAIALAYANTLTAPFIFDDGNSIVKNPQIRSVFPLSESMSAPPLNVLVGRPLISLSFAINYQLGGLNPIGYHLINIASHIACGLLLFGLIRRTLMLRGNVESPDLFAACAALLWSLHPLQTEPVTYITQRTETFMALFLLLTLYSISRAAQSPRHKYSWRVIAILACILGMGCKEIMIVTPLLALLYDWIFLPRRPATVGLWTYAALFASTLIVPFELRDADMVSKSGYGLKYVWWFDYLKTQTHVIFEYLPLTIFPVGQTISYFDWPIIHSLAPAIIPGAILLILLALTIFACARRYWPGFLGACFFLILGPTSSVLPNFTEIAAERRMYLPLAAIVILFLSAIWQFKSRAIIVSVLCIALAALTIARNHTYHSALSIWTDAVTKRPNNALAHYFLARAYADANDWNSALIEDETALRLEPRLTAPAALHQRILDHLANRPDMPASLPGPPGV